MEPKMKFVATTYSGLEPLLEKELGEMGAADIKAGRRMASFTGDLRMMYKVNYLSRFALRILWQIDAFTVKDQDDFYKKLKAMDWQEHMDESNTLAIQAISSGEVLQHSRYTAQLAKDAIVDHFREQSGQRPSVDLERPDISVNVHIRDHDCSISLDSSGDPLYKRGWRAEMGIAPLSEIMASALVKISGWDGTGEFLDPMCGSGTIAIEAAMQALQIPAGKYRRFFGFYKWKSFDKELWQEVREEADKAIKSEHNLNIRACDASWKAMKSLKANLEKAGLEEVITTEKKPFQAVYPRKPSGVIITNPPYDERIRSRNNARLYAEFGDVIKQRFQGYTAWVFSGDLEALKKVGLKSTERHILFNGQIECRLARYDIFASEQRKARKRIEKD